MRRRSLTTVTCLVALITLTSVMPTAVTTQPYSFSPTGRAEAEWDNGPAAGCDWTPENEMSVRGEIVAPFSAMGPTGAQQTASGGAVRKFVEGGCFVIHNLVVPADGELREIVWSKSRPGFVEFMVDVTFPGFHERVTMLPTHPYERFGYWETTEIYPPIRLSQGDLIHMVVEGRAFFDPEFHVDYVRMVYDAGTPPPPPPPPPPSPEPCGSKPCDAVT